MRAEKRLDRSRTAHTKPPDRHVCSTPLGWMPNVGSSQASLSLRVPQRTEEASPTSCRMQPSLAVGIAEELACADDKIRVWSVQNGPKNTARHENSRPSESAAQESALFF